MGASTNRVEFQLHSTWFCTLNGAYRLRVWHSRRVSVRLMPRTGVPAGRGRRHRWLGRKHEGAQYWLGLMIAGDRRHHRGSDDGDGGSRRAASLASL